MTLDNVELAALMDEVRERLAKEAPDFEVLPSDADFPERRMGVVSRRVLDCSLTARDLAVVAARNALEDSGVSPESIGAVFVNVTAPHGFAPSTASTVHAALGLAEDVVALDQSLGCAGSVGNMYSAEGAVGRHPERPNVLTVSAEYLTSLLDASDRTTMPIFGDCAGSAVYGPPERSGLPGVWMSTSSASSENITIYPVEGTRPVYRVRAKDGKCFVEADTVQRYAIAMEGRAVFKDMVRLLPTRIEAYCARAGVDLDDIDLFVFHQANARMIDAVTQRLMGDECARERVPVHVATLGNTSSASVPILVDQLRKDGAFGKDKLAFLCAFGTGYAMGLTLLHGA